MTFSAVYGALRNTDQLSCVGQSFFRNLLEILNKYLIFSISSDNGKAFFESISDLKSIIDKRRKNLNHYMELLNISAEKIYSFGMDAVPWRLNLLLGQEKTSFIKYCLDMNLPISDWYPRVTPIFADEGDYPGAKWHEAHIVNFPLLIADKDIVSICENINRFYMD